MLLVGFGFLMVFVKKYGYSATTGTYLVVAVGLPVYMLLRSTGVLSSEAFPANSIKSLLFAEFAVAAALIAMGAVLGRLKLYQYALLALVIVPAYMINEWLVLDGGLGVTKGFQDSAGSIIIHAFGAYFGLGLAMAFTKKEHQEVAVQSDDTSDRFSMIGSMVLWLFWPSFCSAVVPEAQFQQTHRQHSGVALRRNAYDLRHERHPEERQTGNRRHGQRGIGRRCGHRRNLQSGHPRPSPLS